ncbi:MAG: hypothetical protein ACXVJF_10780 [Acidimicrobiia bacterium]
MSARTVAVAAVVVACLPILVAVVRALLHHWIPLSDDAITATRTQDVFTSHFPLLGQSSSASLAATQPYNHPGPLQFVLLALPTVALGTAGGLAIGTGLINAGAVAVAGWCGWRRAALPGSLLATAIAAALAWSMGSELVYDPWTPHTVMLPAFALCLLAWAVADGDLGLLPLGVAIGSFMVQTHLTSAFLVPTLLLLGIALGWRRAAAAGRRPLRVVLVAVLVGVILWIPPFVEELRSGKGNITRLVEQLQHPAQHVLGRTGASRITATILADPPFWLRPSLRDALRVPGASLLSSAPDIRALPVVSPTHAAIALAAIVVLLALLGVAGARRRDHPALTSAVMAGAALAVGWYSASQITVEFVGIAPHHFRFLWPVAAFVTFAVLLGIVRAVVARSPRRGTTAVVATATVAIVVLTVINLPASAASGGPQVDEGVIPAVRAVDAQLGAVAPYAPVLAEWSGIGFQEPYSGAFTAELRRRDIDFVVSSPWLVRHYGTDRRYDGHNARSRIFYRLGVFADRRRLGRFHRIAYHRGPDPASTIGVYIGPVHAPIPPLSAGRRGA